MAWFLAVSLSAVVKAAPDEASIGPTNIGATVAVQLATDGTAITIERLNQAVQANNSTHWAKLTGLRKQGGLLIGQLKPRHQVLYNDTLIQLDAQRQFIIGLDRDASASIELMVIDQNGHQHIQTVKIEQRNYPIQYIEGVEKKYIAPSPKQLARSRHEALLVKQARAEMREQNNFFKGFIWPVNGPITGVFGSQRVYNGKPRRPHYGVDIARAEGTAVVAPASGKITLAESNLFFSGGTLIIDHGHSLSSSFLHLSQLMVKQGEYVEQGQVVAKIGATGRVTGAHLDWRMNWLGVGKNIRIDPQMLVSPMSFSKEKMHNTNSIK